MKEKQLYLFGIQKDIKEKNGKLKLILPLDTIGLAGVGIIILLIFSFSFGVEKGKKIESLRLLQNAFQAQIVEKTVQNVTAEITKEASSSKVANNTESQNISINKKVIQQDKILSPYRIQVASFQKENTAIQEAKNLKNNGYVTSTKQSGKYTVLYVEGFADESEANNNLRILRKRYKDCILKRRL